MLRREQRAESEKVANTRCEKMDDWFLPLFLVFATCNLGVFFAYF